MYMANSKDKDWSNCCDLGEAAPCILLRLYVQGLQGSCDYPTYQLHPLVGHVPLVPIQTAWSQSTHTFHFWSCFRIPTKLKQRHSVGRSCRKVGHTASEVINICKKQGWSAGCISNKLNGTMNQKGLSHLPSRCAKLGRRGLARALQATVQLEALSLSLGTKVALISTARGIPCSSGSVSSCGGSMLGARSKGAGFRMCTGMVS